MKSTWRPDFFRRWLYVPDSWIDFAEYDGEENEGVNNLDPDIVDVLGLANIELRSAWLDYLGAFPAAHPISLMVVTNSIQEKPVFLKIFKKNFFFLFCLSRATAMSNSSLSLSFFLFVVCDLEYLVNC